METLDVRPAPTTPIAPATLSKALSYRDGLSIVVGSVIGSGIFLVAGTVALQLYPLSSVLFIWSLGGVLSIFGALSLGELASLFPAAGGIYIYLQEAYGRPIAFLYGWALFTVIQTGTIATLASAFAVYLATLTPLTTLQQKFVAVGIILILSAANCLGIKSAKYVQNFGTGAKLLGLAILFYLLISNGHFSLLRENMLTSRIFTAAPLSYGIALVAVLWAYEGWHAVSFVASEFHTPQRDLPRSLLGGMLVCTIIYLAITVAYYTVLTPAALQGTSRAAATAVYTASGRAATIFVSILICTSVLGGTNSNIMTGSRVFYAMAIDGLFFKVCGRVNPRFRTPVFAIIIQAFWSSLLVFTGTFQQLFTYVIFTAWLFYALAIAAVIVLRIRRPLAFRSFRAPGYPWIQLLFIAAGIGITISTVRSAPFRSAVGIAVVLIGLPIYLIVTKLRNRTVVV